MLLYKNLQCDIISIVNTSGVVVAKYEYDTFWDVLSVKDANNRVTTDTLHVGLVNPFRCRGYYYDTETELYYLNARYYNPKWRWFINADGVIKDLLAQNLFAYCSNSFVNGIDNHGNIINPFDVVKSAVAKKIVKFAIGLIKHIMSNLSSGRNHGGGSRSFYTKKDVVDEIKPKAQYKYSCGDVYIVELNNIAEDKIDKYYELLNPGDIIVADARNNIVEERYNPNMKIYYSYKITSKSKRREILELLHYYNLNNPSSAPVWWNRAYESMESEWDCHNKL